MSSLLKVKCCCGGGPIEPVDCSHWKATGPCASSYAVNWTGIVWRAHRAVSGGPPHYDPAQYLEWTVDFSGTLTRTAPALSPNVVYNCQLTCTTTHVANSAAEPPGSCCAELTVQNETVVPSGSVTDFPEISITCFGSFMPFNPDQSFTVVAGTFGGESMVDYEGSAECDPPSCTFATPAFVPNYWFTSGPPFLPPIDSVVQGLPSVCLPSLSMSSIRDVMIANLVEIRDSLWPTEASAPIQIVNPGTLSIT